MIKTIWGGKLFREGARMPEKKTIKSRGYDVYAWTPSDDGVVIPPMGCATINTGVNLRIPDGCHVDVKSRSGLAHKYQVFVLNADGLIDEDYLGHGEEYELKAILFNLGKKDFVVEKGDRIAQIVLRHSIEEELRTDPDSMDYDKIKEQMGSERIGGFGSTGV